MSFLIFCAIIVIILICFQNNYCIKALFCDTNHCLSRVFNGNAIFGKTVIEFSFCDIRNYQGLSECSRLITVAVPRPYTEKFK
jgi:hypothetical protein